MRNILEKNKKGQLSALPMAIVALILAGVILVLGLVIMQELRDTQVVGTDAFTAGNATLAGVATFADFFTIIVLAVVITIVIGLLLSLFGGGRRMR